jgi:hypothetical protein
VASFDRSISRVTTVERVEPPERAFGLLDPCQSVLALAFRLPYDSPMRRTVVLRVALVPLLAVSLGAAFQGARTEAATTTSSPPGVAQQPAAEKVSYCHRTASVVNPYNLESTAVDSIVKQGHGSHTGPVFPEVGPDGKWGDIIPPFDYDNGTKHFPGLNWPAGASVIAAGCAFHETIEPPPEETTTTTVAATSTTTPATTTTVAPTTTTKPATTTTPGQTTTTALGAGSGSTTTIPGVTTTTTGPTVSTTTTTTTIPPPTGTPPPTAAPTPLDPPPVEALAPGEVLSDPPPRVVVFVVVPGNQKVVVGVLRPEQVRALFRELSQRKLAHTGNDTDVLVVIAFITLLTGGALLGLARPRRRAT